MFEVWDELWSKSRKMISYKSFRRKSAKVSRKQEKLATSPEKKEFRSRIPVLQKRDGKYIQTTDLDQPDPVYSEITNYGIDVDSPRTPKYRKHEERIRPEGPEYIRRSCRKHNRSARPEESHYSNASVISSHYGKIRWTSRQTVQPEPVTCNIYETLTPKKPKYRPSIHDSASASSLDEFPQVLEERAVVHPEPVITKSRYPTSEQPTLTPLTPLKPLKPLEQPPHLLTAPLQTTRLVKDKNGVFISPILTAEQLKAQRAKLISPPQVAKVARRNLEDRFIVNTYKSSAGRWSLGRRDTSLAATQIIQVCERLDSGIHSDSSSDNSNQQRSPINIAKQTSNESNCASSSDQSGGNECKSRKLPQNEIGFVGELYRARITPDTILAKNLKLRQRQRRVPSCLLNLFDEMSTPDAPDSPHSPEKIISFLDQEASKLEDEIKKEDVGSEEKKMALNSTEVIYATPLKVNKSVAKPKNDRNIVGPKKSFTDEICERLNSPMRSSQENQGKRCDSIEKDAFIKLKEEADYQCKVMRQASKALEVSRNSDSFMDIRPLVEAEKILLTASCRYEKVLQEIRQTYYEKPVDSKQIGSVQVSNFAFNLCLLSEDQTGWFVLVLTDDQRIFSTTPTEVHSSHCKINFKQSYLFDNLNGNFEITGKIYCLPRKQCEKTMKRTESRLSNKLRLSGRKFRYMDLYTKDPVENNIITSSFIPMAYFKVNVNDLTNGKKSSPIEKKLTVYENSPFIDEVEFNIHLAQMKFSVERIGMMNIRSAVNPVVWNRRWCTLSGTVMKFWNSPLDESFKDPLSLIDLVYCQHDIESAKREECPRPKTLSIVTNKGKFFLNIDTIGELREWKKSLNDVYKGLKDWNLLKQ